MSSDLDYVDCVCYTVSVTLLQRIMVIFMIFITLCHDSRTNRYSKILLYEAPNHDRHASPSHVLMRWNYRRDRDWRKSLWICISENHTFSHLTTPLAFFTSRHLAMSMGNKGGAKKEGWETTKSKESGEKCSSTWFHLFICSSVCPFVLTICFCMSFSLSLSLSLSFSFLNLLKKRNKGIAASFSWGNLGKMSALEAVCDWKAARTNRNKAGYTANPKAFTVL